MNNSNPSLEALAKMCINAYGESHNPPMGWDDFGDSLEFNKNKLHGHYAKLYKSQNSNTYVIANRGTRTDYKGLVVDGVNDFEIGGFGWCYSARKAFQYYNYVIGKITKSFGSDFKIYVTGHSKGAFEAAYIIKELKGNDSKSAVLGVNLVGGVGFNCPGFGVKINPMGIPIWNNIPKDYLDYPFLNINREGDVISNNLMGKLGRELLLPGDGLFNLGSNHAMDYKYELFKHYNILGSLEINENTIYTMSEKDFDNAIIESRVANLDWINSTNLSAENKSELSEITHGVGSLVHIKKSMDRLLRFREDDKNTKNKPKL